MTVPEVAARTRRRLGGGTKFTNYSMSSSVIRRNQQLSLLDDKFNKFMDQYDEAEEGALEGEEIEGCVEETSVRTRG